jgi:hypothetical protein
MPPTSRGEYRLLQPISRDGSARGPFCRGNPLWLPSKGGQARGPAPTTCRESLTGGACRNCIVYRPRRQNVNWNVTTTGHSPPRTGGLGVCPYPLIFSETSRRQGLFSCYHAIGPRPKTSPARPPRACPAPPRRQSHPTNDHVRATVEKLKHPAREKFLIPARTRSYAAFGRDARTEFRHDPCNTAPI